ncbi:hypothetical protein ABW21_db0202756 [Orbilia brochopaga]|nr:hypothetical protein ABW21_db0202756 [Drechslerella brochopaga]
MSEVKPGTPNLPLSEMNIFRKRDSVCFPDTYCWRPDFEKLLFSLVAQPDVPWTVKDGDDNQFIFCTQPNGCMVRGKAILGATSATVTL